MMTAGTDDTADQNWLVWWERDVLPPFEVTAPNRTQAQRAAQQAYPRRTVDTITRDDTKEP